jgi:hypothetical protein
MRSLAIIARRSFSVVGEATAPRNGCSLGVLLLLNGVDRKGVPFTSSHSVTTEAEVVTALVQRKPDLE